MKEIWRTVKDSNGRYEVSNLGRLKVFDHKNNNKPQIRKPTRYTWYQYISLYTGKSKGIHIAILESFIGDRPKGYHACHNDGNPRNNKLSNLRWDTPSGNARDAVKHKKMKMNLKNRELVLNEFKKS